LLPVSTTTNSDRLTVNLMFLDLGRLTGYCYGPAGSVPTSGSIVLRKTSGDPALGLGRLARWLRDHVRVNGKPDLLGIEHYLPTRGADGHTNIHSVEYALRLNGCVHAVAGVYGIEVTEPYPATIRSQVCGAPYGQRQADGKRNTKEMVLRTMILLGYVPKNCVNEDQADAACGFAYLEAAFARKAPANFVLRA
jgi:hypothetical protein